MGWLKTKTMLGAATAALVMTGLCLVVFAQQVQNFNDNSSSSAATTLTCTFPRDDVNLEDVIIVTIGADKSLSTLADSSSNSYVSIASSSKTGGAFAGYAYIYAANATTVPARGATLTITATLSASGYASMTCLDTIGAGHWAHTGTGEGDTNARSFNAQLNTTFTPTTSNFEISVFGGMTCDAAISYAPSSPTAFNYLYAGSSGTVCYTGTDYYLGGASAYYLNVPSGTRTDEYQINAGAGTGAAGTIDWAEAAADFAINAVVSTSVGVTASLTSHHTSPLASPTQTVKQGAQRLTPTVTQTETVTEGIGGGQPQYSKVFLICEGVSATVTGGSSYNSGPVCNAPGTTTVVVATQACTFFQLQCWWYPLMFMGMYSAFVWVPVAVRRGSEKAIIYSFLAGATLASWVEVLLGVMTPALPVMLIAANITYSFNLIGRVASRI